MRVALLSDIHGNAVALNTVLTEINQERPDRIVCLGDIAATGPQPVEVLTRVQRLDCPIVMGNTDEWLLSPQTTEGKEESLRRIQEIDIWCSEQLSSTHREFIQTFEPTIEVQLNENTDLLCYHGSPRSHSEQIEATTPEDELDNLFAETEANIFAGGHTHVQLFRRYKDTIILNSGSIGLPHERNRVTETVRNPPWAEYALVTATDGSVDVELRRTSVDTEAVIEAARESDMPRADWWAEGWLTES